MVSPVLPPVLPEAEMSVTRHVPIMKASTKSRECIFP